jgi:hypothetical protein
MLASRRARRPGDAQLLLDITSRRARSLWRWSAPLPNENDALAGYAGSADTSRPNAREPAAVPEASESDHRPQASPRHHERR